MLQIKKTSEYRGEIYANNQLALYVSASVSNGELNYMNQSVNDWNTYLNYNTEIMADFMEFQKAIMEDIAHDKQLTDTTNKGSEDSATD